MAGGNSLKYYTPFRLLFVAAFTVSFLSAVLWGCSELPTSGVDGPNTAPVAIILSPVSPDSGGENGKQPVRFRQGEEVYFQGYAYDAEEDTLDGKSVNWTSDKDGVIGTGRSFVRSELSRGLHHVALTVIDGNGAVGRDSIRMIITGGGTGGNGNPHKDGLEVNILSKTRGLHFFVGDIIVLEGEAVDGEGNELSGESLEWSSDRAGELGTGQEIDLTGLLAPGKHTVTLTATDSTGLSGTDWISVSLTKKGGEGNREADVEITAPSKRHFFEDDEIVLQGRATDDEGSELEGDALQWSSDLDGELGSGGTLDVTGLLSLGKHTITLSAMVNEETIGSASIQINITRKGGGNRSRKGRANR